MPELSAPRELTRHQQRRPSTFRTLIVLLLVFVFCISALVASGALDENIPASEASTRILTAEEASRMAEESAAPQASEARVAPVALIGLLLFVAGALLISLAVPTRAERRREKAAAAPPPPPRRRMGAGVPDVDDAPTTVLQPPVLAPPPAAPPPAEPAPIERRYRAGAIMR